MLGFTKINSKMKFHKKTPTLEIDFSIPLRATTQTSSVQLPQSSNK